MGNRTDSRPVRRWPLVLIAAPAAVAIWSGWVGLGELCGFGVIHPLPGILPGFQINTAITLPVGVEAYAAFALGAWMSPASPERARKFARRSAIGALIYGMAGQIIFHLLAAAHATAAPWPVVVVVSCMPVAVLGLAAGLTHLLRAPAEEDTPEQVQRPVLGKVPSSVVTAAEASMRATFEAGNPWSVFGLQRQFPSLTRAQATAIRDDVLAPMDGGRDAPTPPSVPATLNGHGSGS
jgi:hypothetical protein